MGGLIFWCHIFLPFRTFHGVLLARGLAWVAISSSSGMHFVRTLNYDLSVLGGPAGHGSWLHWGTETPSIYSRETVTFGYTQNVYVNVHSIFILCNQTLETLMCLIVGEWLNNCGIYIPWNNIKKKKKQKEIAINMHCCCCCCCVASVVSDSVRPHRWQPTRLPRPWDSLGKNTGVGCQLRLNPREFMLSLKIHSHSQKVTYCGFILIIFLK